MYMVPLAKPNTNDISMSTSQNLIKRAWATAWLAGGSTFFGGVAVGAYQITKVACSAAVLATLAAFSFVGTSHCLGWAAITALSASVSAMLASGAGSSGWQWLTGSSEKGKRSTYFKVENPFNLTMYSNPSKATSLELFLTDIHKRADFNSTRESLIIGAVFELYNRTIADSHDDNELPHALVLGKVGTTTGTTLLGKYGDLPEILHGYVAYHNNVTTTRRASVDWVSYDYDGSNGQLMAQHFTEIDNQALENNHKVINAMWDELEDGEEGASKYCLAWGDSHTSGADTMILGETYVNQYGGVDSSCESA